MVLHSVSEQSLSLIEETFAIITSGQRDVCCDQSYHVGTGDPCVL